MSSTDPARPLAHSLPRACAALLAAALGASACATPPAERTAAARPPGLVSDPATPLDQYAVGVERSPDVVALSVHPQGLSGAQRAALATFASRWRDTGGADPIVVQAPVNSAEPGDPRAGASAVAAVLQALGVPAARLELSDYDAQGRPGAPLYARYERYRAYGPDCRLGWDNLTSTLKNTASTHFACANAANLAALIADPHDLERPAPTAPADSVRRAVVLAKYRDGVITSSPKDPQAQGVVSSVVN